MFVLAKLKPLFMDKIQQSLMDLRMRRASIKTMLTNYQMFEETYQEEIDQMLDDLSKLTKTIEFLEEKLECLVCFDTCSCTSQYSHSSACYSREYRWNLPSP